MKRKNLLVHVVAADDPLTEGHPMVSVCEKEIERSRFEVPGSTDFQFAEFRTMVNCRQCRKATEPTSRYLYGVSDVAQESK